MSQHRYINRTVATLATAACLAFASGVGAAEPNDARPLFQMAGTVCHPAYRSCQKEAPLPAIALSTGAGMAYVAEGEFDHVAFGSACHPAYRPCSNWPKSK
jgi:hypothetical protein